MGTSHWNVYREYIGVVRWRPIGSGIRTRSTALAKRIHAALRHPNVPLDVKLPLDSGQRCCCDWSGPIGSRDAAHWLSLTEIAWQRRATD